MKRETAAGLHGQALNLPAYRDIAIGISRRYMRPSSVFPNNTQNDDRTVQDDADAENSMGAEQWMGHIADLQAAHSSHVAGMVYGRGIMEQPGTTAHRREMFRLSSTDWHRFLGFVSSHDGGAESALGQAQQSPWEVEAEQGRTERRWLLQQTPMEPQLQQLMGTDSARFRGVQGAAMQAIQQGQSPVVAIMPTGSGKSMLFMLPAWVAPRGTTVVVVPLIALRGDLQHRWATLGITCVEWESRRPPDEASIVLVTPESAITEDFMTFLNRQRLQHRLDRIVIDECHVILNNQKDFRPAMAQLGRLTVAQTQMVYLTATLPPTAERRLFDRIHSMPQDVQLFRSRTCRTNVAYRVYQPEVDGHFQTSYRWVEAPEVTAFIYNRIQRAQPGKVIIYASTIPIVVQMAQLLECEAYHSKQVDKAAVLARFRSGAANVIVATSALGLGVDIPDIRCIIHVGQPRTLLDYAQESGRAGRDGLRSEAVIIQPAGLGPPKWEAEGVAPQEIDRVECYMEPRDGSCRRVVLDRYLDGTVDGFTRNWCGQLDAPGIAEQ